MIQYVFYSIIVSAIFYFIVFHLRPLNEKEIFQLAKKRRKRKIRSYFRFNNVEFIANPDFKRRMKPNGSFYNLDERLYDFPAVAASLLKYKKHEWIIISFENNQIVDYVWLNKGFDRESVSSYLTTYDVINVAKRYNYSSVLIFHNHPNPNPKYLTMHNASKTDIKSAKEWGEVLIRNGINLLEFVCERGKHFRYFYSISDKFLPPKDFAVRIKAVNDKSKIRNLFLHIERKFLF